MEHEKLQKRIDQWFQRDTKETFLERIKYTFESEKMFEQEQDAVRYGHTLDYILKNISVVLDPDAEIVGQVKLELPTDEQIKEIDDIYKKWWTIPTEERHKKVLFYYSEEWLRCRPYWIFSLGHLGLDWESILALGFGGLKQKARAKLEKSCNQKQKDFLSGAMIIYDAFTAYCLRYADEAQKAGKKKTAETLRHISLKPAENFAQALQLLWIIVLVLQKVCGCGVLNCSRMDKYLRPLYEKGINDGTLTKEKAVELLEEFFYRNNEIMMQTDHMSTEIAPTAHTLELSFDDPNYVTLGGKNPDGTSAVCELSFLIIQAARNLKLRNPFLVIRYHEGIDEEFWRYSCEALRDGTTIVFYNDETMIPALKYFNVEEPEVYDYGFFGCNNPIITPHEGGLRQVWMNLVKPLELALNEGDYPMQPRKNGEKRDCEFDIDDRMIGIMKGAYYGAKTKPIDHIRTMEEFLAVYEEQLNYLMCEFRKGFEHDFEIEQDCTFGKIRIEDCFLRGTVDHAVTWTEGGTKYHKVIAQGCGLATVINALYVIDQVVFKRKEMTLRELADILKNNYRGHEELALKFKNKYAKFGNDCEDVDKFAKIVTDMFIRTIDNNNGPEYLYQLWPAYSTDRDFTTMGQYVGATADGRFAKEQISENQSPVVGTDTAGLTALLNSLAKIPFDKITGGPLNLMIHPSAVSGKDGLKAMCALFQTYMQKGGMQLQPNIVGAETLKCAQKTPDKYRTLSVRVTGYSAFFVEMGKKAQNEMIKRTEHMV